MNRTQFDQTTPRLKAEMIMEFVQERYPDAEEGLGFSDFAIHYVDGVESIIVAMSHRGEPRLAIIDLTEFLATNEVRKLIEELWA